MDHYKQKKSEIVSVLPRAKTSVEISFDSFRALTLMQSECDMSKLNFSSFEATCTNTIHKMTDIKYSFHNNESDFWTTHWVLIVICACTVYVGRRYFAGLVIPKGIGISHAVSRRRRILRDPLSRRPPPIITYVRLNNDVCSRSSSDHARKANSVSEDELVMPSGSRRISKNTRPQTASVSPVIGGSGDERGKYSPLGGGGPGGYSIPALDLPAAPKHIPFPNIPMESELEFEIIMFIFTIVAAGLQFLQIYRSVWWLPHAYTNQAVNFYLIDTNLLIFILVLFSRRLIYMLGCLILQRFAPAKIQPYVFEIYRGFLLIAIFSELTFCGYKIVQNHSFVNIFYLCYPISVYLILFGLTISPFFELIGWSEAPGIGGRPLHSCTSSATAIRGEVDNLKTDFNNRMKQVLFSSVLNAYYAGFVPCCFAQSYVYYDVYGCTLHLIFVGVGCFTMYAGHILPMRYCDVLHRSALHLGAWSRVEPRSHVPVAYNWVGETLWPAGSLVRHSRELYRAQGTLNAAEPGNPTHARFHSMFKNPSVAASGLVGLQLSLVVVQLALLVRSSQWQQIVSLTLLLFVNYYTLFKLGRDYLVALKLYRAEQTIQEKYMFQ